MDVVKSLYKSIYGVNFYIKLQIKVFYHKYINFSTKVVRYFWSVFY